MLDQIKWVSVELLSHRPRPRYVHHFSAVGVMAVLFAALLFLRPVQAASTYPITVTDLAGQQVTITAPPQRIVLQDGRLALDLALLNRSDPFAHIVLWNNLLKQFDPDLWALMSERWKQASTIPDMGFDDNGAVNLEAILAHQPDLLVAELRARPVLEQNGTLKTLALLHIPVLFVDNAVHPVPGAAQSVQLLGAVLDHQAEAKAYVDFYQQHLAALSTTINGIPQPRPSVFVEPLAGRSDIGNCCFSHGDFGWGLLVQAVGAQNLGSTLLKSPTGQVSVETLLSRQPDAVVMTGRLPGSGTLAFGYGASGEASGATLRTLAARPGFAALDAVKKGRVYGIYHPFYSSVLNIVALEYLATFIYPHAFPGLDPNRTYDDIVTRFTHIPQSPVLLAERMPG
jgi:iron complex transport system substrate-binding protein